MTQQEANEFWEKQYSGMAGVPQYKTPLMEVKELLNPETSALTDAITHKFSYEHFVGYINNYVKSNWKRKLIFWLVNW
jgi:hypothetical protein